MATTPEAFEEFGQSKVPLLLRSKGIGRGKSSSFLTTEVNSVQVSAFDSQQKQDIKSYMKFNGHTKMYFRSIRQWRGQSQVDNVERIFDSNTTIPDENTEDFNLWNKQQAYVMSMLNTAVSGGHAHTIIKAMQQTVMLGVHLEKIIEIMNCRVM